MPGKSPHRWRGVSSRPYTRRMSTTVRKTRNYQNTPRQWPRLQTPDPCGQRENGGVLSSRAYLLFTMSWNKPSSPWASTETDLFHRNVLHEPPVAHRCTPWWSQTGSNRRLPACKAGALPAELWPLFRCRGRVSGVKAAADRLHAMSDTRCLAHDTRSALDEWWAWEDLNFRPHAYQARALTN